MAWSHDVVEDTEVTLDRLLDVGFPVEVEHTVEAITPRRDEPRTDYDDRVRANDLATVVTRADIADNTGPERVARLDPETRTRVAVTEARARRDGAARRRAGCHLSSDVLFVHYGRAWG